MINRFFLSTVWVAGTAAATALGWTSVALVAQRVIDHPSVMQRIVVLRAAPVVAVDGGKIEEDSALDRPGETRIGTGHTIETIRLELPDVRAIQASVQGQ